jgi:DsbC/DsbD-like thiol-disulfide interchange protein
MKFDFVKFELQPIVRFVGSPLFFTETWLVCVATTCHFQRMNSLFIPDLNRRTTLKGLSACAILPLVAPQSAWASEVGASPWSEGSHSALRLIAAGPVQGKAGHHHAGIAIKLAAGFKTYWRHPGDSGVPPVFNFEGSDNLKEAIVHYPAPKRFPDGAGGTSLGYAGSEVVLPVTVIAVDTSKPVRLKLKADYAICEKICIPASASVTLALPKTTVTGFDVALQKAREHVPKMVGLAATGDLQIIGMRKSPEAEHILVDVRMPAGATPDIFLEGEAPWFFETKVFTDQGKGAGTFSILVVERNKAADCTGADLVMTLTLEKTPMAEKQAIEVHTRLDVLLLAP